MKKTPIYIDRILAHVAATLPDSLTARRDLLLDMLALMGDGHPQFGKTRALVTHLYAHEEFQLSLSLAFKKSAEAKTKSSHAGDGDGNGSNS